MGISTMVILPLSYLVRCGRGVGRTDSEKEGHTISLFNAQVFRATRSELEELYPSNHT